MSILITWCIMSYFLTVMSLYNIEDMNPIEGILYFVFSPITAFYALYIITIKR